MTGWNKGTSLWLARALAIVTVLAMFVFAGARALRTMPTKPGSRRDDAREGQESVPADSGKSGCRGSSSFRTIACFAMAKRAWGTVLAPRPSR